MTTWAFCLSQPSLNLTGTASKELISLSHKGRGQGPAAWITASGAHEPGPTCQSALRGTIGYLRLSSGNPAGSLRKEKLQLNFHRVTQPWPGRPLRVWAAAHLGGKWVALFQASCTQRTNHPPTAAGASSLQKLPSQPSQLPRGADLLPAARRASGLSQGQGHTVKELLIPCMTLQSISAPSHFVGKHSASEDARNHQNYGDSSPGVSTGDRRCSSLVSKSGGLLA